MSIFPKTSDSMNVHKYNSIVYIMYNIYNIIYNIYTYIYIYVQFSRLLNLKPMQLHSYCPFQGGTSVKSLLQGGQKDLETPSKEKIFFFSMKRKHHALQGKGEDFETPSREGKGYIPCFYNI